MERSCFKQELGQPDQTAGAACHLFLVEPVENALALVTVPELLVEPAIEAVRHHRKKRKHPWPIPP